MQNAKVWIGKHESQVIGAVIFLFGGFLLGIIPNRHFIVILEYLMKMR